jgi:hypothetical protein
MRLYLYRNVPLYLFAIAFEVLLSTLQGLPLFLLNEYMYTDDHCQVSLQNWRDMILVAVLFLGCACFNDCGNLCLYHVIHTSKQRSNDGTSTKTCQSRCCFSNSYFLACHLCCSLWHTTLYFRHNLLHFRLFWMVNKSSWMVYNYFFFCCRRNFARVTDATSTYSLVKNDSSSYQFDNDNSANLMIILLIVCFSLSVN